MGGHGGRAAGDHLAILHAPEHVPEVRRVLLEQNVITRNLNKRDFRALEGNRTGVILEIIRGGKNEAGALFHHIVYHLFKRGAFAIGGVDLIQPDHLGAGDILFQVLSGDKVRLAVAVVVLRTDQDHSKHERLGGDQGGGGRGRHRGVRSGGCNGIGGLRRRDLRRYGN